MIKCLIPVTVALLCGIVFPLTAKENSILLKPELNKPYDYELQMLLNTSKDKDYPVGYVQLLLKVDYSITFINADLDFHLIVKGLKGFVKPSLIRTSSDLSKTQYINTYDSLKDENKRIPFLNQKILISAKDGVVMENKRSGKVLEELRGKGLLEPFIQNFQENRLGFFQDLALKKGRYYESVDSLSFNADEYIKIENRYQVKDFDSRIIQLTSTGRSQQENEEAVLGQRITLSRKTGMPRIVHQYIQLGNESEMFTLVKMKGIEVPDVLREFERLNMTRLHNVVNVSRKNFDIGGGSPIFDQEPYEESTEKELGQKVSDFTDSLLLVEDELKRPILLYSGYLAFDKNLLKGAYVKSSGGLKITSKDGDTLSMDIYKRPTSYFALSALIGPFETDIFGSQPQVESWSLDLTLWVATKTKKITLDKKSSNKGEFQMELSDSTVSLTYQHDGIRYFSPFPMHSIKFYGKNGNKVEARLIAVETTGLQKIGRYTKMELAEIYTEQDVSNPPKTISYVFEAENVSKAWLEVYTDEIPFTREISKH